MLRTKHKSVFYYALAALAAMIALLFRDVLSPEFGWHYPYHTVWLSIIFAAWYCGIGASLLAIGIDALGIWYWYLPPYRSFSGKSHTEYFGMLGFLAFSGIIVTLGESNRRLFIKRQRAEQALKTANDELENRVWERTAELERSNEAARRLSARVITVQDEERRRLGRALHDSLSQYLAALKIILSQLDTGDSKQAQQLSECEDLVEESLTETRTIAYLLHPPLLDELGFCAATRLFVDGFSRRSGLPVTLDLPSESARVRFSASLEIALFRAVQEGLTNIHKYAKATSASIRFSWDASSVRLAISDNGKGIPAPLLKQIREGGSETGVGIAGMRERLRELDGTLEIESGESGTILAVLVPAVLGSAQPEPVATVP